MNRAPISKEYLQKQIKNGDILLTYIGMLCQGKPQYEAVREMMDDPDYYKYALGIAYAIPSAETLRQRFDMIGGTCRCYQFFLGAADAAFVGVSNFSCALSGTSGFV